MEAQINKSSTSFNIYIVLFNIMFEDTESFNKIYAAMLLALSPLFVQKYSHPSFARRTEGVINFPETRNLTRYTTKTKDIQVLIE